jgi:Vta1 like
MPRTAEKDSFLSGLLDEIEIDRGLLNQGCLDTLADKNQSSHFILSFALRVFSAADEQVQDGTADL